MFRVTRKGWVFRLSILLVCILMLLPVSAWAADQTYHVPKADFDIVINEDGSANVVETWTLDFEGNTFSRFYKDIFADQPKDEEFSAIEDLQVSIDGVACELTDQPRERPEETYYFEEEADVYRISAFRTSTSVTEYVFSYKLTDVVKNVDQEYNLFVFRPIGAHFEKKVENVNVHFHGPSGSVPEVLYCTKGDSVINGSDVDISAVNCKGMYKIRIRMDGADIPGAVQIGTNDLTKEKSRIGRFLDKTLKFFAEILTSKPVASFFGCFLPLIIMEMYSMVQRYWKWCKDKRVLRRLQKHPELFQKKLQIIKDNMKPAELALFWTDLYFYEYVRLIQRGIIILEQNCFLLNEEPKELDQYEREFYHFVMNYIRQYSNKEVRNGWYLVDYDSYEKYVYDHGETLYHRGVTLKDECEEHLMRKKNYNKIRSAYKVLDAYRRRVASANPEYLYDLVCNEKDPYILAVKIDSIQYLNESVQESGANAFLYRCMDLISYYHRMGRNHYVEKLVAERSRSSGSFGSSGSSCSSCGGGGAD